jgi:hypothetical protein
MLKKPLQRMSVGGLLTAASFFISGILENEMMKTYAKVHTNNLHQQSINHYLQTNWPGNTNFKKKKI